MQRSHLNAVQKKKVKKKKTTCVSYPNDTTDPQWRWLSKDQQRQNEQLVFYVPQNQTRHVYKSLEMWKYVMEALTDGKIK